MKYIAATLGLFIIVGIHAGPVIDKQIRLTESQEDLRTVFTAILQQTGIPILYEGCPQKITAVDIPRKSGSMKEILDALSGTTYVWSLENGVLLFQDKEFISDPHYPVKQYKFDYQIDTDNLEKFLEETAFFDELWKERISNSGLRFVYKSKKSFKKTYKNASLRDILLDLLKDSNSFCFIYKYSKEDRIATYQIIRENKSVDYHLIKNPEESLYGLVGRSYGLLSPEFIPEKVLDGRDLLTCSFNYSRSDDRKAQITACLKNNTSLPLHFVNFKTESLILLDVAFESRQMLSATGEFLIYPSLESGIPEEFTLKPSEEKTFTFPLDGARYLKAQGAITTPGSENKYSYRPYPAEILKKPHKFSLLKLIIYFYDSRGQKYKTISRELVDAIDENE